MALSRRRSFYSWVTCCVCFLLVICITAASTTDTEGKEEVGCTSDDCMLAPDEDSSQAIDDTDDDRGGDGDGDADARDEGDNQQPEPTPSVSSVFWSGINSLRSFASRGSERLGEEEDLHVGVGERTSADDALPSQELVAQAVQATLASMNGTYDVNSTACSVTAKDADYTAQRIRSAKVSTNPYPHVYVTDVYPTNVYACIRRFMPGGDDAAHLAGIYRRTQKKPRFSIPLRDDKGPFSTSNKRSTAVKALANLKFWNEFSKYMGGAKILDAWLSLFQSTLKKRIGSRSNKKLYYSMDLTRDLTGYNIRPHRDTPNKYVTTLYYLPETAENPFIGTVALRQKGSVKKNQAYQEWKHFDIAKAAAYVPNVAFAFVPCERSWHGVLEANMTAVKSRDTLQAFVRSNEKLGRLSRC